ncbi:ADP-ribosylglycohydrolase [Capsaspora owczarzaki ATCC 30864]|uniref:ADP-ribosylglycohydrolase n=1 Tax=Capsaspora owczarzaki (strain ATCC 30864) TaxID=595528 RepID=A0A0D2UGJ3_CAPO3|nr:ADP-ribosylglycohydrolase [Capsaspora owczarzaki ATCC 30864]KJE94191.1 ADP-ribosylglycohydrolase [Capsaspora owczarzaki ATCC 30864]|eukprot:XP_004347622.1 ADP-ribosylglycohydrolase [Capsaspora owczarzaki ATCC 30864]
MAFAVHPKHDCPHVETDALSPFNASQHPQTEENNPHSKPCRTCGDPTENWVCLQCLAVHCGREINGCAAVHGGEASHPIVLSLADHSIWCYACDSYITHPLLTPWYEHIYRFKFGTTPAPIHGVPADLFAAESTPAAATAAATVAASTGAASTSRDTAATTPTDSGKATPSGAISSDCAASASKTDDETQPRQRSYTLAQGSKLPKHVVIDRIKGVVFGQAIGDAFGLATEFMSVAQALEAYGPDGPADYSKIVRDRHRSRWVQGDWTDDTDQMIVIMRSLIKNNGKVVVQDIAEGLLHWVEHGFPEVGDVRGLGLGNTVGEVVEHPDFTKDPHGVAQMVWEKGGKRAAANGGVMRTAILGVLDYNDIAKVIENTRNVCKITHADPRCIASCVSVTTAIALILQGAFDCSDSEQQKALVQRAYEYGEREMTEPEHIEDYRKHVFAESLQALDLCSQGMGYTLKTLGCGFYALRGSPSFEGGLRQVTMCAGDADTNAAVFGALAGAKVGFNKLPTHLRDTLPYIEWIMTFINQLLDIMHLTTNSSDPLYLNRKGVTR